MILKSRVEILDQTPATEFFNNERLVSIALFKCAIASGFYSQQYQQSICVLKFLRLKTMCLERQ